MSLPASEPPVNPAPWRLCHAAWEAYLDEMAEKAHRREPLFNGR
jgi:hypothetical protein